MAQIFAPQASQDKQSFGAVAAPKRSGFGGFHDLDSNPEASQGPLMADVEERWSKRAPSSRGSEHEPSDTGPNSEPSKADESTSWRRESPSPPVSEPTKAERPRLNLQPRTRPIAESDSGRMNSWIAYSIDSGIQ